MGLDAMFVEILENDGRNPASQNAFAAKGRPLDATVSGRDILVPENDAVLLIGRKDLFLIAVEQQLKLLHNYFFLK